MIYKNLKLTLTTLAMVACFASNHVIGQIEMTENDLADELANYLVGDGVTISGATLDCFDGGAGFFKCIDCSLGMDSGIVLTSGGIDIIPGPNNSGGTTGSGSGPGDDDLEDLLPGYTSYDACVLEFDLVVISDSVKFDYVFGSEEYLEWVGSSFNDVFGFFISGPGISGVQNIALIPGTTTPVSINNVNSTSYDEFYVNNGDGFSSPYSTDDYYIEYDGFTTVLSAATSVFPCETYHLKLAVSDMGDQILDSGVFLRARSLSSAGVTVEYNYDIEGFPYMIEGCNDGEVSFSLFTPAVDTLVVNLILTGSATNGVDYSTIPDSITFYPGDSIITIPIEVYEDSIIEGLDSIVISGELSCAISSGDSIVLYMNDYFPLEAWPQDTIICQGESVNMGAINANAYFWSPYTSLDTYEGDAVVATPASTTDYVVTGIFFGCVAKDTLHVEVEDLEADAGDNQVVYYGTSAELFAEGDFASYTWSPPLYLNDANIQDPISSPLENILYILTVESDLGCFYTDSVTVQVIFEELVYIPNAFSPNGDDLHEQLYLVPVQDVEFKSFVIYNRWGVPVFTGSGIDDGWDGRFQGKDQEIGTYMYIFVGEDEDGNLIQKQGTINLLR